MAITGYEKRLLSDYTKQELIEIAKKYSVYYTTATGQGRITGYSRLSKEQLISIIKNDADYKDANPKNPKRGKGQRRLTNRLNSFKESLIGTENPDDLMNEILSLISNSQRDFIIPGKYYTYVYYAATPKIVYDRYPLIKAGDILEKGFNGFNYHLGKIRQYNTVDGDRLVSGLYELSTQEFNILLSVPYRKLIKNP